MYAVFSFVLAVFPWSIYVRDVNFNRVGDPVMERYTPPPYDVAVHPLNVHPLTRTEDCAVYIRIYVQKFEKGRERRTSFCRFA